MALAEINLDRVGGTKVTSPLPVTIAGGGGGGGAATIADGANVTQGVTTDAAVVTDANGTLSGKLRGLVKILADIWDAVNHRIKVDGSGVTQPVSGTFWQATQPVSGSVSVSNLPATQPVSGTFWQTTQPVSASSLPLPAGASTEATLALIKAKTDNLDVLLSSRTKPADTQPVSGTFWQATQPVSAASLPLPSGASTSAKQDTGNTSLASIDGKIPASPAQEHTTAANPSSVRLTDGAAFYKPTTPSDTQPVSGTFFQATQPVSIASMPSTPVTGAFFQATQPVSIATMPSTPVTGTFFQATQPISAVSLPLPTGAAQDSSLTTIDTDIKATQPRDVTDRVARLLGHVTVDSVPTTPISAVSLPLPTGAALEQTGNLERIVPLLQMILGELRINNELIVSGLNVKVDPEEYRRDPSYLN